MRKYAFGDLSVPRDDTQYLKIKYPAQYPPLPEVREHNAVFFFIFVLYRGKMRVALYD